VQVFVLNPDPGISSRVSPANGAASSAMVKREELEVAATNREPLVPFLERTAFRSPSRGRSRVLTRLELILDWIASEPGG
jgi:hypothetical protein